MTAYNSWIDIEANNHEFEIVTALNTIGLTSEGQALLAAVDHSV